MSVEVNGTPELSAEENSALESEINDLVGISDDADEEESVEEEEEVEGEEEELEDEGTEDDGTEDEEDEDNNDEEEEDSEDNSEEEEKIEEEKPKRRLKAILKKEREILERKKDLEAKSAEISRREEEFNSRIAKYDMEKIEAINELISDTESIEGREKVLKFAGIDANYVLKASLQQNPEWVKENFKELLEELGTDFNPRETEYQKKKRELQEKEEAIKKQEEERKQAQEEERINNRVGEIASTMMEEYPICGAYDRNMVIQDIRDNIGGLLHKNIIPRDTKLSDAIALVLPHLERHYEQVNERVVTAFQSKRAKQSAKNSSERKEKSGKDAKKETTKKSKSKPKKTVRRKQNSAPRHTEKNLRGRSFDEVREEVSSKFDIEELLGGL